MARIPLPPLTSGPRIEPCSRWAASLHPVLWLAALLVSFSGPAVASAQDAGYRIEVRNVPLDQALRYFAQATGTALAYDPDLIRGNRVSCIIRTNDREAYLRCLLAETNLEFFRRASGTYVIGPSLVLPAQYGLITGQVREAETDTPLSRAHIVLRGAPRGTISSPAGVFVMPDLLPGRYSLSVSHLGYETWSDSIMVRAGSPTWVSALLARRVLSVEPILIEQSATSLFPLDAPTTGVLRAPVATGVATGSFADLTAGIHIQGANEGHLEIQLDGHPVYLPRQLLGMIGPFSGLAIGSLTEERAGFGAAEGSMLGGVLDFRQDLGRKPGLEVKANRYALESSVGYRWAGGPSAGLGATSVRAAVRRSITGSTAPAELRRTLDAWVVVDPFLLFGPTREYTAIRDDHVGELFDLGSASPAIRFSDLHLNLEHERPSGSTWTASAFLAGRGIEGDRRRTLAERNLAETSPLLSSVAKHDWNTLTATLGWRRLLGQRTFLQATGRVSRYRYSHDYSLADFTEVANDFAAGAEGQDSAARFVPNTGDGNDLDERELSLRLDHSMGGHALSGGLELTNTESRFNLRLAGISGGTVLRVPAFGDSASVFLPRHRAVSNAASSTRLAAWAADRWEGESTALEGSLRLTLLPSRSTVYAEPRLRAAWKPVPALVVAAAGGAYRQFVHQFDYSTLNAGELVPSTRFWLPLDETASPARALHLALDADWQMGDAWTLAAGVFVKRISGAPALRYTLPAESQTGELSQADLLLSQDARHRGLRLQVERTGPRHRSRFRYDGARDRQLSSGLFGGRWVQSPWSVPHRFMAEQELASGSWAIRGSLTLERGMRWALRQAYYDYFGSLPEASFGGWDLSDPDAHQIPDRLTADLGIRWEPAPGIVVNAEILNAFDRSNTLDQRLLWTGGPPGPQPSLRPSARLLPGRMAVLSVQLRL